MTFDFRPYYVGYFIHRTRYAYYIALGRITICIPRRHH